MPKSFATRDRLFQMVRKKRTNTVTSRRPDELQLECKDESLADLMARRTLSAEQVVDAAAGIARELALMHRHGLAYGALESRNILISGGRAALAPMAPPMDRRAADDIRDFGVWLRGLAQTLPEPSGGALAQIASRYLETQPLDVSMQMRKAAMALCLLRVAAHGIAAPVSVSKPPAQSPSPGKRKVLMLIRVVHGEDGDETAQKAPSHPAPWYAAAIAVTGLGGVLFFLMRGIL